VVVFEKSKPLSGPSLAQPSTTFSLFHGCSTPHARPTFPRLAQHVTEWTVIHALSRANPNKAFYSVSRAHAGMDQGTAIYRGPPKDSPVHLSEAMRTASSENQLR
jgi:hypothetical protein